MLREGPFEDSGYSRLQATPAGRWESALFVWSAGNKRRGTLQAKDTKKVPFSGHGYAEHEISDVLEKQAEYYKLCNLKTKCALRWLS